MFNLLIENGINIDNWTLDELVEVVQEFQAHYGEPKFRDQFNDEQKQFRDSFQNMVTLWIETKLLVTRFSNRTRNKSRTLVVQKSKITILSKSNGRMNSKK